MGFLDDVTAKLGGKQVQSWVGTGENQPVTGQQVQQAVDPDQLHSMAKQAGMTDEEASEQVAKAMPEMVNQATPKGQIPEQDPFAKGLDSLKRMLKL